MQKSDRFMIPARLLNEGGFSNETTYRIRMSNGESFEHLGFTDYTFNSQKYRNPNEHWQGEKDGYVEVILCEIKPDGQCIVEPPQCHNCEHSGFVWVAVNDLIPILNSQRNRRDRYGDRVQNEKPVAHPCG